MPFTLAHPAAVLPLRHLRGLRTAPLVIGAMVPDTPYYLPASHRLGFDTHSLTGSYTIDLPLGIVLLACALLLREPLTALLPARARWLCLHALEPFRRSAREWLLAPLAVLIGVCTHLLWDSFTHGDGWIVRHVPALRRIVTIGAYNLEVCHVLQYLSSAVGLAIVLWWYARLRVPREADTAQAARRARVGPALLLVMGAALLIGGVEAARYYYQFNGAIYRTLDVLLTRSLAWFVLLDLVGGTIVTLEHRAAARHD
jgi:Domain of unknown function (DUF4184)